MIALGTREVIELLDPAEAVASVESALRAYAAGECSVPQRHHIEWQGNTFLSMPAVGRDSAAVKFVTVAPGNAGGDLPVTLGLLLLHDVRTGEPLAVIDAGALTAIRTGAVGALGVKYMTPPDASSIGIVGCGVQGTWQAIVACAVRPIHQVFAVRRTPATFEKFARVIGERAPQVQVIACHDARELLGRTDIVIAATTAAEPVLPDEPALLDGKHFISVGSYRRTMQELPDSVYRLAGALVIDSEGAREEVGDVVNAVAKRILAPEAVYPVADLVLGTRVIDVSRTTAYKTAGHALFDLYAAQALYAAARRCGAGYEFNL